MQSLQISQTPIHIFVNILLASIFSWMLIKLYLRYYKGYGQPYQMCLSLMVCSVVTCAIIMVIGANIALSLGLVGALSIIRFRTPIKDSRDLAYIFWGICIGLGCGAGAYIVIIILMLVLGVVMLYLESNTSWATRFADYLLILTIDSMASDKLDIAAHLPKGSRLKSITSSGDNTEITYSLSDIKGGIEPLLEKLQKLNGVKNTHVVSPDYEVLG
jgi:uncharacterized membrane protein YhiD involved in acid resistance